MSKRNYDVLSMSGETERFSSAQFKKQLIPVSTVRCKGTFQDHCSN
jgi:hypothetical protein